MFTRAPREYKCILTGRHLTYYLHWALPLMRECRGSLTTGAPTDISMPVMDGLEAMRRIREFERTNGLKSVTIITLTGLSGAEIEQDAFLSGVDMFLTRPLPFKGLVQALQSTGVLPLSG